MTMQDTDGASAVEYALIVVAIAAVIVVITVSLGILTAGTYQGACDEIAAQQGDPDC